MTFTEIRTRIKNACALSSTDADTRLGISINQHYRRITSLLGMDAARFVTRNASTSAGVRTVTFSDIEKIDRVIDATDSDAIRLVDQTSVHEIRSTQPGTSQPTKWAFQNSDADSVTIILDTIPQEAYSLQADGWSTLSDLSGSDEPAFPESFHDVLTWFVIAEELLKKEKERLALAYEQKAEKLLADLRFHFADSHTQATRQGGGTVSASGGSGGSSGSVGGTAYTQTALITFDRDPSAPFAVTSGSAVVTNLDADKLDGSEGSAYAKLADAETVTGAWTFSGLANTGLKVLDTGGDHALSIVPGSNLTAARTLTLTTGDAARTVTLSGNPTLADWFDQSVKTTASPTFASPIASTAVIVGAASTAGIRLDLETGTLAVREGDDSAYGPIKALTAETTGALTVGGAATVTGDLTTSAVLQTLGTLRSSSGADLTVNANGANRDVIVQVNASEQGRWVGATGALRLASGKFLQLESATGPRLRATENNNVANDGTFTPYGASSPVGFLFIHVDDGSQALYVVNTAATFEVSDVGTVFSTTQGTGSSYNVYVTGGALTIENKSGNTRSFKTTVLQFV